MSLGIKEKNSTQPLLSGSTQSNGRDKKERDAYNTVDKHGKVNPENSEGQRWTLQPGLMSRGLGKSYRKRWLLSSDWNGLDCEEFEREVLFSL